MPGFEKKSARIPYVPPERPLKIEVRTAPHMPGKTLASKIIKPVGAALLLLTSLAGAQPTVLTAPHGAAPANVPEVCAALNYLGITNVRCPPASLGGTGTSDDTAPLNTILAQGGTVHLPTGTYRITGPLGVVSGTVLEGEGCTFNGLTFTGTILQMTGTSGYCGLQSATPWVCTGGAGACDATLFTAGRGAGCPCHGPGDCASGVCAGGTAQRDITIRNLCLRIQVNKSCGISLAGISQSHLSDLVVFADATGATDITGVRLSDIDGLGSGYANVIEHSRFGGTSALKPLSWGIRLLPQANGTSIQSRNRFQSNFAVGVQVDPATLANPGKPAVNTVIRDNLCEDASTECFSDAGKGTALVNNYCEQNDVAKVCLHFRSGSTSAQIGYNFFTPSGITNPVVFDGGVSNPIQTNWESNVTNVAKWTNSWGLFDFADYNWGARSAAYATCISTLHGRTYYDAEVKKLCVCDNYSGADVYCPVTGCVGGETASNCG